MSDDAVRAKTGKSWPEWFAVLDATGAAQMSHQEIVAILHEKHGLGSWWQQMVTVAYEQERGLRALHQKPEGYEVSATRTIDAAIADVYEACVDEEKRRSWLPADPLTIRKATPCKSIRARWTDGTIVEFRFYPKDMGKIQVTAQHGKLPDSEVAGNMKAHWGEALARLKSTLEK